MDISELIDQETVAEARKATEERQAKALPKEGKYVVSIYDWQFAESPAKKTPYIKWKLKIQGGESDGRMIYKNMWMSPGALPYSTADLITIGVIEPGEKISNEGLKKVVGSLQNVFVKHKQEEWQGETKTKLEIYFNGPADQDSAESRSDIDLDPDDDLPF